MTDFPTALDTFTNPTEFDQVASVAVPHHTQHANLNDAVAALETKVGIDSSVDTASLDYKVNDATVGVASKVSKAGDTMTGFLVLHADPDANLKAATKQYVDTMLPKAGGTMTGFIVLHADPDAALKAATKQYVDARQGVAIPCWAGISALSPADSTTYYFGASWADAIGTTYDTVKIKIPKAGTIKYLSLVIRVAGTLASGETVSHYVRINDTTDVGQTDTTYDAATRQVTNTSINQAVVAGDFVAIKIVTPAWATNPTSVRAYALIFIE